MVQIMSYNALARFLVSMHDERQGEQEAHCYGPNCGVQERPCMYISTGIVTMILLIGFLWADIINALAMLKDSVCGARSSFDKFKLIASLIVLSKLS